MHGFASRETFNIGLFFQRAERNGNKNVLFFPSTFKNPTKYCRPLRNIKKITGTNDHRKWEPALKIQEEIMPQKLSYIF